MIKAYPTTPEHLEAIMSRGPWVATADGGMWSIHDPRPEDVRLFNIASGLSRNCRYNGQLRRDIDLYTVAEHSCLITRWMMDRGMLKTREDALKVHLHDASESILPDMVSPVKRILPEFVALENKVQGIIESAFGLEHATISKDLIKEIDTRIRLDEREVIIEEPALTHQKRVVWEHDPGSKPLGVKLQCLLPRAAREMFLEVFLECCALPLRHPDLESVHDRFIVEAERELGITRTQEVCPSP